MNISIKAKSSSSDSFYTVDFFIKNDALSVLCDCPAGEWGKLCKHKWQLLNGDKDMLADPEQSDQLMSIHTLAVGKGLSDLYKAIETLEVKKKILAKEQKKEKDSVKKSLSKRKRLTEEQFLEANQSLYKKDSDVAYVSYLISKEKEVLEQTLKNGF